MREAMSAKSGPSEARKNTRLPGINSTLRKDCCKVNRAEESRHANSGLT